MFEKVRISHKFCCDMNKYRMQRAKTSRTSPIDNIFKNPNQLAGFNFIHGLRLTNVTEILSDSNFMDCLVGFHFRDSVKLIGCFISAKETQLRQM